MLDKTLAGEIVKACKEFVGLKVAALAERIDGLAEQLKSLPAPKDGEPGRAGVDGKDGAPGERGTDGAPGVKGDPGDRGADGAPGRDGVDGAAGRDGVDGKDGLQGLIGEKGIDGAPGKDGEDGRDALDLDIQSFIDENKRYRRDTFASHKGGLWRATKTTQGMDGWVCIVDGVAEIKVSFQGRTGFVSVEKSSGTPDLHPFTLPAMLYRGVFKDGDAYEQGDTVTWGGSLWFCNEATAEKPLDGSKVWQLAAKRGRDGKDGRNGIDMTKAVQL